MPAIDLVLVVARLVVGCWLLWTLPRLRPAPHRVDVPAATGPLDGRAVSVIVPARNEAGQLPALLATLPDDVEVVVVDDGSTDGTAEVASDAGAVVVTAGTVPAGWTGKAWACARGARRARGTTLVFVDADVRFVDDGFDRVLRTLDERGGLVSVQPFHEPGSAVEHLAALFNVVAVAATDTASPLGRRSGPTGAFGPVLATSRADYDAAGTHEAVRDAVVDDVALAARYRDAGLPADVRVGIGAVVFRMYPLGLGQLVEGFTKNLATGVQAVRAVTVALVVWWMSLLVQAATAPLVAVWAGGWPRAAVLYAVVTGQFWWMARRVGRFGPLTAALFPVHLALFLFVFARSCRATVRGSVSWRGRQVATRRRRPPGGR